ncbi:MAG: hypothetical protein B0W54_21805 [Cellvibrio sp. 79]|nr:MAG: hypothetical protein B0W54_21805 [Cellvibrio sp. 79]
MDFDFSLSLDEAYRQVLMHPLFKHCTHADLFSCQTFCDVIRQSPVEEIRKLQDALELIAYETDDHNEAVGFLLNFVTLEGGFNNVPADVEKSFESIPVEDADKFADWLISIPVAQRSDALIAAQNKDKQYVTRYKQLLQLLQKNLI